MILHCNYEEITALKQGAHTLLSGEGQEGCAVLAPPVSRTAIEALMPRLRGDLSIETLAEQRDVEIALAAIVECLRAEMESFVATSHPADEGAVAAYFDFAHALSVLSRVREMGREMEALIELVTGEAPTDEVGSTFAFPD